MILCICYDYFHTLFTGCFVRIQFFKDFQPFRPWQTKKVKTGRVEHCLDLKTLSVWDSRFKTSPICQPSKTDTQLIPPFPGYFSTRSRVDWKMSSSKVTLRQCKGSSVPSASSDTKSLYTKKTVQGV